MASELRDQLQSVLGSSYSLTRELGGGGMSRVFLAHEPSLGRDVVVKVLHPELASGVNIDRFKREIQLAAQLQHPHIVPILTAGETDGLPYLTMPYVAGRSLRERLTESPMLPFDEAIGILRDVARALAYAHGRGVIHRDIKPDNVLLAEGSATVTDFGVAKAIESSRPLMNQGPTRAGTLTTVGTSIGTPAYMAPEQAAGDPDTDHRADIYAWGVMAYEMLAGRPPFTATSPHKLLAAHMSEAPQPLADHRPDCPPALASLVMRCLEKDPDARPQSAGDVVRTMTEVSTPSGGGHDTLPAIGPATRRTLGKALALYAAAVVLVAALAQTAIVTIGLPDWVLPGTLVVMALGLPAILFTAFVHHGSRVVRTSATGVTGDTTMARLAVRASPHVTWRRTALGGVAAVGVFAALVVGYMVLRAMGIGPAGSLFARGVIGERDRVLVTDFEAPPADSMLGGVVSEGVRTGLTQSRAIVVVPPAEVSAALQRMQRPTTTRLDLALARDLAQREGIKAVVDGKVAPVGATGSYIVAVQLVAAADGAQLASVQESAKDATELIPAIDRATRKLRGRLGESLKTVSQTMSLEKATTASLPALRKYTEGLRANSVEQNYPKAIAALEEAIRLDTTFALAYRLGALAYSNAGLRPGRADSLRTRAFELRDRLPELERALVEGGYYNAGSHANRPASIAAYERVIELDPTNPSALNSLALLYTSRRDYARAESLYTRSIGAGNASAFAYSNIVSAQVNQGKLDDAQRSADEFRRRFPNNPGVPVVGWTVWAARGRWDSVRAQCARAAASPVAQIKANGTVCLGGLDLMRGRVREYQRRRAEQLMIDSARGVGGAALFAALDSASTDVWFRERPQDAVRRLDALVARWAVREYPREQQPYFDVARSYAIAGRPEKARAILGQMAQFAQFADDASDTTRARLQSVIMHTVLGEIAIAEGKYEVAIREVAASDTSYDGAPTTCAVCALPFLARAYDLAGRTDDAIATFERYLASPYAFRFSTGVDPLFLAGTYKRLGELYEAKGDRQKAASNYAKFVELWKDADPELQPKVAAARERLARLGDPERK